MMIDQITSWDNLLKAFRNAAKGKRGNPNVAAFEHLLEDNLVKLQELIRTRTYKPHGYVSFYIHEPKKRLISAAPFYDRVVHHALCNVIGPIFERSFIHDSYANRQNKGTHRALNRCQQLARKYQYILPCDLRQFFPSIDIRILRSIIAFKIKDPEVMNLIDLILQSGDGILKEAYDMVYFPGDDLFAVNRPRGLPIGNLTSQFWANVYLNPFDHFVKRELRCPGYIRYVDDFLLFANHKKQLWAYKKAIEKRLRHFRLCMHPSQVRPTSEGTPFLGFIVYPQRRKLKKRKGIHFRRRLNGYANGFFESEIPIKQISASVKGWVNHVRYANTVGLRKSIFSKIIISKSC